MAWVKLKNREVLPQLAFGVDHGSPRDVMLRKGRVCVSKTRGHVGWSGIGCQSYYGPQWLLGSKDSREEDHLNRGYGDAGQGRISQAEWASWRAQIAKAMGLRVEDVPAKLPRGGTWVWQEEVSNEKA